MSLYLKHRPSDLSEVVGNEATKESITAVMKRDREDIPHAFLFNGPSGCGKTTLGRILAGLLGSSGTDLVEMDMADFRGIDNIRDVVSKMRFRPMESEARVWILDEVHRLTGDAQSALLKALEDTPPHVYFILCTTDPGKLLDTIRNRCTNYQVEALNKRQVYRLLSVVLKKEKKTLPDEIMDTLSELAGGSARAALVALDKVIDCPEENMADVLKGIVVSEHQIIELVRLIANKTEDEMKKWKQVVEILKGLENENPESIRIVTMKYISKVLMNSNKEPNLQAAWTMSRFIRYPTFNLGMAPIVLACFESVFMQGDD